MSLLSDFNDAKQALYDHVEFTEDWVVYAIEDRTEMFWCIQEGEVRYSETIEKFNSDGDYYVDEIYTQRFYSKHVYRGSELTMIFVNPHVDGNRFFAFFSNDKKIT